MQNHNKRLFILFFVLFSLSNRMCFAMQTPDQATIAALQAELDQAKSAREDFKRQAKDKEEERSILEKAKEKEEQEKQKLEKELQETRSKFTQKEEKFNDEKRKWQDESAEAQKKAQEQLEYAQRYFTKVEQHSYYTLPNAQFPANVAEAQVKLIQAEASLCKPKEDQLIYQNSYRKMGVDFLAETGRQVIVPILTKGTLEVFTPVATEWRQNHIYKTTIEQLQEDTARSAKERVEIDKQSAEQTKENNAATQKHNDNMAEAQELSTLISQFRGLCDGQDGLGCKELAEKLFAIQRKRVDKVHKKEFPTTPPAAPKK